MWGVDGKITLKMGLKKGWIDMDLTLVQDRDTWWPAMNTLINLGVSQNAGKFKYLRNFQFLKKDSAPRVTYSNKLILHFPIFEKKKSK